MKGFIVELEGEKNKNLVELYEMDKDLNEADAWNLALNLAQERIKKLIK